MAKVFISHSSKDKKFVRTLKEDLNENGIETWFDEDQLDLGDSLIEKLEIALEESTHFIIILSNSSISSDWVKLELNKAITQVNEKLMNKIIPIKYRDCEVPKELRGLLYADLSNEFVMTVDDKIKFTTDGYPSFLNKLIKTVKSSNTKNLTSSDKSKLKKELEQTDKTLSENNLQIARILLNVQGFGTKESKMTFINKILISPLSRSQESGAIKPILLPRILKSIFPSIEIGTEFTISHNESSKVIGHFAGFRRDDTKLTLEITIRKTLDILKDTVYQVKFDGATNSIVLFDE